MDFFKIYQAALLSQATYALNLDSSDSVAQLITDLQLGESGMSKAQAEYFASKYRVAEQQENTDSGFAATLFQNLETGEFHFSMRGSES